ncbi:MAG: LicD family protein [Clostridia bacterium]|nr:LicD family protein [Clostridia bacterium]
MNVKQAKPLPASLKLAGVFVMLFLCVFIPARNILEYFVGTWIKLVPDVLVLSLLLWYAVATRLRMRFLAQDFFFLAFLGLGFVNTVFLQGVGLMPFVFQVRSIGVYYILYFVLRNFSFETRDIRRFLRVLQSSVVVLVLLGIVEKVSAKTVLFPPEWADRILYRTNFSRIYSMLNNPNTFGLFLILVFFFGIYCQLYYGIRTHFLFTAALFGTLMLTMSRSSLLALAGGLLLLVLYVIVKARKKVKLFRLLGVSVLVLALGFGLYFGAIYGSRLFVEGALKNDPDSLGDVAAGSVDISAGDRLNETLTEDEIEHSAVSGRIFSVTKCLEVLRDYPILGAGFGTFGSSASMNYPSPIADKYGLPADFYSDCQYTVVIAETGIVGTALFALFLLSVLISQRKSFAKVSLCLLFGWFGLFYNVFEVQIGAMLFWVILSFPMAEETEKRRYFDVEEIKAMELDILRHFVAFCEKHSLNYILYAGTLLGAIRHKGFIPWDDDIDVCMPRPDYDRFAALVKEEPVASHLKFYDCREEGKYWVPVPKLVDDRTEGRERYQGRGVHNGVWIDIFPMDAVPEDKQQRDALYAKIRREKTIIGLQTTPFVFTWDPARLVKRILVYPCYLVGQFCNHQKHARKIHALAETYPYDTCRLLTILTDGVYDRGLITKEEVADTILMPFEDLQVRVPREYDKYLTRIYGDYMTPPPASQQVGRHHFLCWFKDEESAK